MRHQDFFEFARKRHKIYLLRQAGTPRFQWTDDNILRQYRFTNVFRELDRTTVWFREKVRDPMRNQPEVLMATVLFRWFNRITTGEAIFLQGDLIGGGSCTAWQSHLNHSDGRGGATDDIRRAIRTYCGVGPYVTGAYIIKTPDAMNKLDGVLWAFDQFCRREEPLYDGFSDTNRVGWRLAADKMMAGQISLEAAWDWLRRFPFMGDFMAYEVITDLRHTALLDRAPDIMTWANPGPGAMRGLNRIHDRPLLHRQRKEKFVLEMQDLLQRSRDVANWPTAREWGLWEMRDVEHTLCEFDKYERARLGQGRPRGVYR